MDEQVCSTCDVLDDEAVPLYLPWESNTLLITQICPCINVCSFLQQVIPMFLEICFYTRNFLLQCFIQSVIFNPSIHCLYFHACYFYTCIHYHSILLCIAHIQFVWCAHRPRAECNKLLLQYGSQWRAHWCPAHVRSLVAPLTRIAIKGVILGAPPGESSCTILIGWKGAGNLKVLWGKPFKRVNIISSWLFFGKPHLISVGHPGLDLCTKHRSIFCGSLVGKLWSDIAIVVH